jgi:hypothetical protein
VHDERVFGEIVFTASAGATEGLPVKKLLFAAVALLGLSTAAHAAVHPVLDTVTLVGSDYEFGYSATLSGDTGFVDGNFLIIYDFAGYIAGSISAGIYAADIDAYVENTSAQAPIGYDDDPTLANLVFKWNGAPFNASGGPFADVDFAGLTARSSFAGTRLDGYSGKTTINNGAATGQPAFNFGAVAVADGGGGGGADVPEPGVWALMILGFGLSGTALRMRRRTSPA